jgi:2-polyprenyl-3-methyl-5-hydroxy-6-metoxy-1,4-benzoquinol methylase
VAQAEHAAQWIPEGGTVVDFGCGDGRISVPLARMGFDVIAVDASRNMLTRLWAGAQDLFRDGHQLHTCLSDGTDLVEQLGEFAPVDTVVCRAVLIHHSHADVARLVEEFTKILKPGGALIADWPLGPHHERRDWIGVTTWDPEKRQEIADRLGLSQHDDLVWTKEK